MPAELKIQVRFLLGALLETTRKRGFFVRTSELVCRFLQYGLGRTFRNPRGYLGGVYKAITTVF